MNFFIAISFTNENYKNYGQAIFCCNAKKAIAGYMLSRPLYFWALLDCNYHGSKTKTIKIFLPRVRLELTAFRL